ncbi:hypothetical protein J3Q64DRAFT_1776522 [Phycomyces blakesleeanus]|uniref:Uncharacterized protein n=1 Tax=Phycomyces blakesleeanus TaxID=4837 RepID=A0ABR3AIE4_PHYBL
MYILLLTFYFYFIFSNPPLFHPFFYIYLYTIKKKIKRTDFKIILFRFIPYIRICTFICTCTFYVYVYFMYKKNFF